MLAFVVMICIQSRLFDFRNAGVHRKKSSFELLIWDKNKTTPNLAWIVTEQENMRNNVFYHKKFHLNYPQKTHFEI